MDSLLTGVEFIKGWQRELFCCQVEYASACMNLYSCSFTGESLHGWPKIVQVRMFSKIQVCTQHLKVTPQQLLTHWTHT
jgi:hypothetical protein